MRLEVIAVLALTITAAGGVWLLKHDAKVAARTEEKVVSRSIKEGKKRDANAQREIAFARRPGALDRLRRDPKTCVDCSGQPVPVVAPSDNKKSGPTDGRHSPADRGK